MPQDENRLDFVVKNGIAKDYRVILTHQCIEFHKKKYGHLRSELDDKDFIERDVVDAMQTPDEVYPSIKKVGTDYKIEKNAFVFYKENKARRYAKNGIEIRWYIKVIVRRKFFKKLLIITPYYADKIVEKKRCKQIISI